MKLIRLLIFAGIIFSCSKEQQDMNLIKPLACDSISYSFERDIRPILNSNCNFTECHATSGNGSYDLTLYSVVADRIRSGTIDYRLDLPIDDPQHMPENMILSDCDYYIIKTWIKQGYPEK